MELVLQVITLNLQTMDLFQSFVMIFQMIELALQNMKSSQNMNLDHGIHLMDHENDFIDHRIDLIELTIFDYLSNLSIRVHRTTVFCSIQQYFTVFSNISQYLVIFHSILRIVFLTITIIKVIPRTASELSCGQKHSFNTFLKATF